MNDDPNHIAERREMALKILAGEMTPETHSAAFEEDIVFFSLLVLGQHDREWLLREVRDRQHSFEGRCLLASYMGPLRREIWNELREEDPTLYALPE